MFPIQIKHFYVNDVYAGGEYFWMMWTELDDTDGKDGYEEDLESKRKQWQFVVQLMSSILLGLQQGPIFHTASMLANLKQ